MTTDDKVELYDVHLFAVVRVKVANVRAPSHREAIDRAPQQVSDLYERFEAPDSQFAEEFSGFLVDVVGDQDYERSRRFQSADEPLLSILENLVAWHQTEPRDAARLDRIVAEAAAALGATA